MRAVQMEREAAGFATPPGAKTLRDAAYDPLPRIKITDLLLEVDL